jgi:hypothetical protein
MNSSTVKLQKLIDRAQRSAALACNATQRASFISNRSIGNLRISKVGLKRTLTN